MIYLKTYFYVPHEIKFLKLNLIEAYPHIDKFIICEFNRTHTGRPTKGYIFENHINEFPEELRDKILYLKCDTSKEAVEAYEREDLIHKINEPLMRGYFTSQINLDDEDIIISVDADEIIYGDRYPELLKLVEKQNIIQLKLHQFFYKMNYLWVGNDFTAPVISKYKVYKNKYPSQWRYDGQVYQENAGCHFSWCMDVDEMVHKLHTYSHPMYRFCAKKEILEDAIKNKKYPFDLTVNFNIEELDWNDSRLPKNLHKVI